MENRIIPLYPTRTSEERSAFFSTFGIPHDSVDSLFTVTEGSDGEQSGCNVSRIHMTLHCGRPHLEVVAHVSSFAFPSKVSDALDSGFMENTVLVTPEIETLEKSCEEYPVGSPEDLVISMRSLRTSLEGLGVVSCDSIIIRVLPQYLPINRGSGEIVDWPYLTVDAAKLLHTRFAHVRTNAPSLEKQHSNGGMWSHCIFFGLDPLRTSRNHINLERRTVGELFCVPDQVQDGKYGMICPYLEVGLDCALTLPLLFPYVLMRCIGPLIIDVCNRADTILKEADSFSIYELLHMESCIDAAVRGVEMMDENQLSSVCESISTLVVDRMIPLLVILKNRGSLGKADRFIYSMVNLIRSTMRRIPQTGRNAVYVLKFAHTLARSPVAVDRNFGFELAGIIVDGMNTMSLVVPHLTRMLNLLINANQIARRGTQLSQIRFVTLVLNNEVLLPHLSSSLVAQLYTYIESVSSNHPMEKSSFEAAINTAFPQWNTG